MIMYQAKETECSSRTELDGQYCTAKYLTPDLYDSSGFDFNENIFVTPLVQEKLKYRDQDILTSDAKSSYMLGNHGEYDLQKGYFACFDPTGWFDVDDYDRADRIDLFVVQMQYI